MRFDINSTWSVGHQWKTQTFNHTLVYFRGDFRIACDSLDFHMISLETPHLHFRKRQLIEMAVKMQNDEEINCH